MTIEFTKLCLDKRRRPDLTDSVDRIAEELFNKVSNSTITLDGACAPGASSAQAQEIIRPHAESLGFASEKKGLFKSFKTSGLRPDLYKPLDSSGILLEVERGKTLRNNMDMLDFWKTHICECADFLFLFVPHKNERKRGAERVYLTVVSRLESFFTDKTATQVDAAYIYAFGPRA